MTSQPYMTGKANREIVNGLKKVLADTFVLYIKTHSFHWNVEGPHFKALHDLFMSQYTELWNATDEIAERMRALGAYGPTGFQDILSTASLKEAGQLPDANGMIAALAADHTAIVAEILPLIHKAQEAGDEVTADIMIGRATVHEKTAWMLKSLLK